VQISEIWQAMILSLNIGARLKTQSMTEEASLPFLPINHVKITHNTDNIIILSFKVPIVQNNHHKKPQIQHQYTIQISHNSLRKTKTTSNPEPKVDSKGRVTIMDGMLRNPYLEKPM
jgi:hypothetical protein